MNTDQRHKPEPSIGTLLGGIVTDAKDLLVKELTAARLEVQEELEKMKTAATILGPGISVVAVGAILLALMSVYGLHTATVLPLWGCYGIIGGVLTVIGIALLYKGKSTIAEVDVVPRESVEAAKEDIQWVKEHVTSERTSSAHVPHSEA